MPRGAPDYSNVGVAAPVHRVTDLAEVAARLGSPDTHERGGNVVFMDTFEKGCTPWQISEFGTGASVAATAESYRNGGFCVKVVAGSDGLAGAQLFRKFPYPTLNKYGLEFSVQFKTTIKTLMWTLALRDGTQEHQYQGTYKPSTQKVLITRETGGAVAVIEDLTLEQSYGLFHTIKLIADLENGKYSTLIVNERVVDISAYQPYSFAYVSNPHLCITFTLYGDAGENDYIYIDDVIVTQNEP